MVAVILYGGSFLPTATLPQKSGQPETYPITVKKGTVSSPLYIETNENYASQRFSLTSPGAKVYQFFMVQDFSKNAQSAEWLRENLDDFYDTGDDLESVPSFNADFSSETTVVTEEYRISFKPQDNTFKWSYNPVPGNNPLAQSYPFEKRGNYTKTGFGTGTEFRLTAADGSVAVIFYHENRGRTLATYPISEGVGLLFNEAAAKDIIAQWKTNVTPIR